MNGSILDRYGTNTAVEPKEPAETDILNDVGAFGFLRGVKDRAVMLELRHRDGRITAWACAWLDLASFDPSEGITLGFDGRKVTIRGGTCKRKSAPMSVCSSPCAATGPLAARGGRTPKSGGSQGGSGDRRDQGRLTMGRESPQRFDRSMRKQGINEWENPRWRPAKKSLSRR